MISNSFVFKFDSPAKVLYRRALIELFHCPDDYDETFIPGMLKLTSDNIQEVAKKRWDLKKFVILVVGNESAYNSLVKALQDPPEVLRGLPFRRVKFDEKLIF